MCDFVPGELLVSFPHSDPIGRGVLGWIHEQGRDQGIMVAESAEEALMDMPVVRGTNDLFRVLVPPGSEQWKINCLYNIYLDHLRGYEDRHGARPPAPPTSETPFCVAPNSLLHAAALPATGPVEVTLTDTHRRYRELIGLDRPDLPTGEGVTVAVLDSGIVDPDAANVDRLRDFVSKRKLDEPVPKTAVDDNGHGTAVCAIIGDIAPRARLIIHKVLDRRLDTTEFDVLLALRSVPDAQVINMSLSFGFAEGDCKQCGRLASNPSRSMVFEADLRKVLEQRTRPIVVASAGNCKAEEKAGELAFPARYKDVVAVGSGTAAGRRSSFSKYGARDLDGREHQYLFFLPGGEDRGAGDGEYVAKQRGGYPKPGGLAGTSFATAYASAVTALLWPELGTDGVLGHLRDKAVPYPTDLSPEERGNGLMRFAPPDPW